MPTRWFSTIEISTQGNPLGRALRLVDLEQIAARRLPTILRVRSADANPCGTREPPHPSNPTTPTGRLLSLASTKEPRSVAIP